MSATTKQPDKAPSREAIYLDGDADIAAVIETIKGVKSGAVALVLPKRNDVFKSIVNLKLIKRVSEQSSKSITLVTTDLTTIGLAARLKLMVSPNLQTEPAIPPSASSAELELTPSMTPIDIAPPTASKSWRSRRPDNQPRQPPRPSWGHRARPGSRVGRIQYHGWFWLVVGLLIVLLVVGFLSLPDPVATVTIETRAESVSTQLNAHLSADLDQPDWAAVPVRLPLESHTLQRTLTAPVTATGQRSIGNYASGDITIINCQPTRLSLPNQTVVSRSGLSFVTLGSLELGPSNDDCDVFPGTSGTIRVRATQFGANYNLEPGAYRIDSLGQGDYRANGGRMTGGSQRLVTVINQGDIDQAVDKIEGQRDDQASQESLGRQLLDQSLHPLASTFQVVAQKPQSTVEIGDELAEGQVRLVIDYRLEAVSLEWLDRLAQAELAPQMGELTVIDNGLGTANYRLVKRNNDTEVDYELVVDIFEARIGLGLNSADLFIRIQGLSRKEAAAVLRQLPGVMGVDVKLNLFWHTTVPEDSARVTIIVQGEESARPAPPAVAPDLVPAGSAT